MHNTEKDNLEFQVTWSENNLRYLAGEPDPEWKTECVRINTEGIDAARKRLKEIKETGA